MVSFITLVSSVISMAFFAAQAPQVSAAPSLNAIYPFAPVLFIATDTTKNLSTIPESVIPSACQSQCQSDALLYLTNCTTTMCDCQDDTFNTISSCLDCLVTNQAISSTTEKNLRTEYTATCKTFGITLANGTNSAISAIRNIVGSFGLGSGLGGMNVGFVGSVVVAAVLSVVV